MTNNNWRAAESALIDSLRQMGAEFRDESGKTFVVASFHDEDTGELLQRQLLIDLE